jgi:FtsP/CotA-like multicopper oxidase with cupredoxin domain
MLDDVLLDASGRDFAPFLVEREELIGGRLGDRFLTNGRPSEQARFVTEQGRVERWRVFNVSNARTMVLALEGASVRVIGSDGGLLAGAYVTSELHVAVGQRYDLEVTLDRPGTVELVSRLPATAEDERERLLTVYAVEVTPRAGEPARFDWPPPREPDQRPVMERATISLSGDVSGDHVHWLINEMHMPEEPLFTFARGQLVELTIENRGGAEHPFHLHGQFFEIVDDDNPWTSQPGLKDTVLVPRLERVRVIASMDNPGRWMAHCHILEHAELGMMGEIVVQ